MDKKISTDDILKLDNVNRTIQFGDVNLYLTLGNENDAIAKEKNSVFSQEFKFVYYSDKDAFKIYCASKPNLILAWNDYLGSNNVFFTNDGNLLEHFWIVGFAEGYDKIYLLNYKKVDEFRYLKAGPTQGFMNVYLSNTYEDNRHFTKLTVSPSLGL